VNPILEIRRDPGRVGLVLSIVPPAGGQDRIRLGVEAWLVLNRKVATTPPLSGTDFLFVILYLLLSPPLVAFYTRFQLLPHAPKAVP